MEQKDQLLHITLMDGMVRGLLLTATHTVAEAAAIHLTSPVATAALGRTLMGTAMMGAMLKDDGDSITLRVSGGGPAGVVIACTDAHGNVKGCIDHPLVELPAKENGHLDVGGAVGKDGVLTVIRDNKLQKEPTVGQVPLVSGEIAEDITAYYAVSEQTPTVCALGVLVDRDLSILTAGGYLLQLLPGADEETISHVEENIKKLAPVSSMIRQGMTPQQIAFQALDGFEPNIIDEYEMGYVCDCTRARVERALISLGKQELEQIRQEGKPIEVGCQFCDKKYVFTPNDVKGLIARL